MKRSLWVHALFGVVALASPLSIPALLAGCAKKPAPVEESPPPTPPPASTPEVTELAPLIDDAGSDVGAPDATPKKTASGGGANANQLRIKQCCAAMRAQAKQLGTSPEANELIGLSMQCDKLASQVGPLGAVARVQSASCRRCWKSREASGRVPVLGVSQAHVVSSRFAVCSLAFGALGALAGCGGADATFTSRQFAAGFTPGPHAISVFGVYKDGQMSSGAWDALGPRIAHSLGAPRCDAGFTDALATTHNELASAIDDYARADGPTDELLAQIAPAAAGDLILVLTISGKLPVHAAPGEPQDAPAPMPTGGRGGGRGGMRSGKSGRIAPAASTDELDLSASLYSVASAQSVAGVSMRYVGTSVDEAIAKFGAKLGETFPRTTCAGWNWDAKVDAERIRKGIDP